LVSCFAVSASPGLKLLNSLKANKYFMFEQYYAGIEKKTKNERLYFYRLEKK